VFVEDEDALRRAGCRILEAAGYRVVPAANDLDALRLIDELVVPISVVVTDVVMPGMNGKELAARLTVHHATVPVIFTSSYTDEAIARHGVLGPYFLPKPYGGSALTELVRRVLDGR